MFSFPTIIETTFFENKLPEPRAVGSLSGSLTANMHSLAARTVISAALGGTAEQLGGGKFANGAITGAYTVMFNDFLHEGDKTLKKLKNMSSEQWQYLIQRKNMHLVDAASIEFLNYDMVPVVGGTYPLINGYDGSLLMATGNEAGNWNTIEYDVGTAAGFDVGLSAVKITEWYYVGKGTIGFNDFNGPRYEFTGGVSCGFEVGGSVIVTSTKNGLIFGFSKHVGVSGPGISGNINYGKTKIK